MSEFTANFSDLKYRTLVIPDNVSFILVKRPHFNQQIIKSNDNELLLLKGTKWPML